MTQQQQQEIGCQCDHENLPWKQHRGKNATHCCGKRQRVILVVLEGIHGQDNEERHEGEFEALNIRGDNLAGKSANDSAAHPGGLNQALNSKDVWAANFLILRLGGDDGIGFVG